MADAGNPRERLETRIADVAKADAAGREAAKQRLQEFLVDVLGITDIDNVWVTVERGAQIGANRLWQGGPQEKRRMIGVAVPSDGRAEVTLEWAKRRLTFDGRGFEAFVIVAEHPSGQKVPAYVAEYAGGDIAGRLKTLFPAIAVKNDVERPFRLSASNSWKQTAEEVWRHLQEASNVVLQGPPGTGKTWLALAVCRWLADKGGKSLDQCQFTRIQETASGPLTDAEWRAWPVVWEVVQMHPGYTYEDFVRGMALGSGAGGSTFAVIDRIVPLMANVARIREDRPTILIVDELNRADVATVFGELILILEHSRRGQSVRLRYEGPGVESVLSLPKSLKVVGTMNLADRSLASVDFAVRRRFRFVDVEPNAELILQFYAPNTRRAEMAVRLFDELNSGLESRIRIGHSFLMIGSPDAPWSESMAEQVAYELLPLLREYQAEGRLPQEHQLVLLGKAFELKAVPPSTVLGHLQGNLLGL